MEEDEVNNIIQLICAANVILEGFPSKYDPMMGNPPSCGFAIPDDSVEREEIFNHVFRTDGFFQKFTYRKMLPVAVAIAAKAWVDKKLIYAIHKLARSYDIESVTPHSMHPIYGQKFEKHTGEFESHVGTSTAINLAYSAIEELGLGVGASSEKPRSMGKGKFEWNLEVLEPFKERLKDSGVDPNRTVDWVERGEQTEIPIYPMLDLPSKHSDGKKIRDREVPLPDAINFCEYLRNQLTAHAFQSKTPLLGPYEVYNVQFVARLLILSKCGLWYVGIEDLKELYL